MRFADVIEELKERFRADLEQTEIEWRRPTGAETTLILRELELGVPPAPRDERYIAGNDIERWITELGIPVEALFDSIAMYLARGFHGAILSFAFCDRIINNLQLLVFKKIRPPEQLPTLFWSVYLAFDDGEWWRPGSDRDPIISFTRPAIAKIVEENLGFLYPNDDRLDE